MKTTTLEFYTNQPRRSVISSNFIRSEMWPTIKQRRRNSLRAQRQETNQRKSHRRWICSLPQFCLLKFVAVLYLRIIVYLVECCRVRASWLEMLSPSITSSHQPPRILKIITTTVTKWNEANWNEEAIYHRRRCFSFSFAVVSSLQSTFCSYLVFCL